MKNPFPGMNPFLERRWRDVHASMIVYIRDVIQEQLPSGLTAHVEEDVLIDGVDSDPKLIRPDGYVTETREPRRQTAGESSIQTSTPTIILLDDPPPPRRVEIVDVSSQERVVTAIELLSITNKMREGRLRYQSKQRAYFSARANLVEIDLLRQGDYVLAPELERIPHSKRRDYFMAVHRATRPRQFEVYSAGLREKLPIIAVPLRPEDPDVALDLQSLVDLYHQRSGFRTEGSARDLDPPLSDADLSWVQSILQTLPNA